MSERTGLFGVSRSNHDLTRAQGWGKNIFTNTAPIALAQNLAINQELDTILIKSAPNASGEPRTVHDKTPWSSIIDTDPETAGFWFETPFDGFREFTAATPEKSDVVVVDAKNNHTRALEIKLTVVPDSTTASKPHEEQGPEIVARPPTIEQLAYTICESYGASRRNELQELILNRIPNPQQFEWSNHDYVHSRLHLIEGVVRDIVLDPSANQVPLVLNVIWRTEGQRPIFQENCFEVFVWTNLAFLTMFYEASHRTVSRRITRPQRSLVWLVKMIYDYTAQRTLDRRDTFKNITFGQQTDKAGSFSGTVTAPYLAGPELTKPRIPASTLRSLIHGPGVSHLAPERRLDATMYIDELQRGATPRAPEDID